jgi:hypothetical protein
VKSVWKPLNLGGCPMASRVLQGSDRTKWGVPETARSSTEGEDRRLFFFEVRTLVGFL